MGPFVARSFWSRRSTRQSLRFNPAECQVRIGFESRYQRAAWSPWMSPFDGRTLSVTRGERGTNISVWHSATIEALKLKEGSSSYGIFLVICKCKRWRNKSVWICVNRRAASHWLGCALFTRQAPYRINTAARWICIHLRQIAGTQRRRQIISITDVVPDERQRFCLDGSVPLVPFLLRPFTSPAGCLMNTFFIYLNKKSLISHEKAEPII